MSVRWSLARVLEAIFGIYETTDGCSCCGVASDLVSVIVMPGSAVSASQFCAASHRPAVSCTLN